MQFVKNFGVIQRQSFLRTNTRNRLPTRGEAAEKASKSGGAKKLKGKKSSSETNSSIAKKNYRPLDQDEHNWEEIILKMTSPFPPRQVTPEQEKIETKIREDFESGSKEEEKMSFEYIISLNKRRDLALKALPPALAASANKKVEEWEVYELSHWIPRDQFNIPGPKDYPAPPGSDNNQWNF